MNRRGAGIAIAVLVIAVLAWKLGGERTRHGEPTDREPPPTAEGTLAASATTPGTAPSPLPSLSPAATGSPASSVTAVGRVVANDAPFEGARVSAVFVDRSGRGGVESASEAHAISAKDGRFELPGLPPPPFRLRAEAPGWRPGWAEVGSFGNETWLEGFVLTLRAAGTIRGSVTAAGKPVAGAAVFAGDESSNDLGGSLEAQAQSALDGTVLLDPVRAGRMTLVAFHPGTGFASVVLDVREGQVATATLALAPLGRVKGRVVDAGGRPIESVRVVAVDPGTLDLVPPMDGASTRLLTVASRLQATTTDADGRFELATLVSRKPSLAIRMPGYRPASLPLELSPSGETGDVEVRLTPE